MILVPRPFRPPSVLMEEDRVGLFAILHRIIVRVLTLYDFTVWALSILLDHLFLLSGPPLAFVGFSLFLDFCECPFEPIFVWGDFSRGPTLILPYHNRLCKLANTYVGERPWNALSVPLIEVSTYIFTAIGRMAPPSLQDTVHCLERGLSHN